MRTVTYVRVPPAHLAHTCLRIMRNACMLGMRMRCPHAHKFLRDHTDLVYHGVHNLGMDLVDVP